MEEETKISEEVTPVKESVVAEEVAPACTNCDNSGKDCVVCTDKTVA